MEASCQAGDDLTHPLGSPVETSTRAALDYLAGKTCTPIPAAPTTATAGGSPHAVRAVALKPLELLMPDRPDTTQRDVPGAF